MWNNSGRTSCECWQRTPGFPAGKVSAHQGIPSHTGAVGRCATSKGSAARKVFWRQKSTTEIAPNRTSQLRSSSQARIRPQWGAARGRGSDLEGQSSREDRGWLWRYSEGANMTPQRQIRENSGTVREAKGHSHGKAVTPRSDSKTLSGYKGARPGERWSRGRWRRPTAPEAEGRGPLRPPPQDHELWVVFGLSSRLPGSPSGSALPRLSQPGTNCPGAVHDPPQTGQRLRPTPRKHSPHTPVALVATLGLLSTTEQASPNKQLHPPTCIQRETYKQGGPQAEVEHQVLAWASGRRGNHPGHSRSSSLHSCN